MKTKITILLLALTISIVSAQNRDYPTQKAVSIFTGKGELSYLLGGGYSMNLAKKFNIGADVIFDFGTYKNIRFTQLQFIPAVHYRVAKIKRVLYFKVGAGPLVNFSAVDFTSENGKKPLGLNFGVHGSLLADIYLSDQLGLFASYKVGWQARTLMGSLPYFAMAGIKFNFE